MSGCANTRTSQSYALAVGLDRRVGLTGGHSRLFDRLVMADLEDQETTTYQMVMPDGADLPVGARVAARGGRYINVVVEGQWLRLDIEKVPAS